MLKTIWAEVRNGKIEPKEKVDFPEGTKTLITFFPDDESQFWLQASQGSAGAVWNNKEDDVYEQLLEG